MLDSVIDYAGLFPPAGLSMSQAVRNHAEYRNGRHRWALGRFIVPLFRLDEFAAALFSYAPTSTIQLFPDRSWQLSVLVGAEDIAGSIAKVQAFNERHRRTAHVDTLESKGATPQVVEEASRHQGKGFEMFHEISLVEPADSAETGMSTLKDTLSVLARAGGRAKVRTGGVTADAFPPPAVLARFLEQCAAVRLPFKATAGLHHPIRGNYPLTYETNSATTTMHGFVNVSFAAAFARAGWRAGQLEEVLGEQSPAAFRFDADGAAWRGHRLTTEAMKASREEFLISFGSCSFEDPMRDLESLGWLQE